MVLRIDGVVRWELLTEGGKRQGVQGVDILLPNLNYLEFYHVSGGWEDLVEAYGSQDVVSLLALPRDRSRTLFGPGVVYSPRPSCTRRKDQSVSIHTEGQGGETGVIWVDFLFRLPRRGQ